MTGAAGTIVSIHPHSKRHGQYKLKLTGSRIAEDGEAGGDQGTLMVHEDVVVALGLRVGTVITEELADAIAREQEVSEIKHSALRLLGVRSRSRPELASALVRKRFRPQLIDEVLAKLENLGLIDDQAFARELTASLVRRQGYGRRGLEYRLRGSGVSEEVVRGVVDETLRGVDEVRRAVEALSRRLPRWEALPPEKRRAKGYQFLARLGYDGEAISDALNTALADE